MDAVESVEFFADERVEAGLQGAALLRVGKDLARDPAAFRGVGQKLVRHVVRVEDGDASLTHYRRKEGFPAGNPSRDADFHRVRDQ